MGSLGHIPINQMAYLRLLDLILTQKIPRGSRLDEKGLVTEMGISRTPLREAIARLVEKGLVEYRPYQGNFVRDFTREDIQGIYKVRKALEQLAIREAIAHMTPELLEELRQILHSLDDAITQSDIEAIGLEDQRFHSSIIHGSKCSALIDILGDLDDQIQVFRSMANQNSEVLKRTSIQRPQILAAIVADDADTAAQLLGDHIDFVCEFVLAENNLPHEEDRVSSGNSKD